MNYLYNYIDKYGDLNFKEKEFNEIDNLIFSSLSYLNFKYTSINKGKNTLQKIASEYFKLNNYKKIKRLGFVQKDAYRLLFKIKETKRYKNIILSNYVRKVDDDMQFSAVTFKIKPDLKFISFEGTDEQISGWKEDCKMSCTFPINSQIEAIKYVDSTVKKIGPKVILGGHSKGGNLALVSGMFTKRQNKIKQIYNNDGPGLRKQEFEREEFKKIKEKYIHIIPNSTIIGVLLNNENNKIIKSNKQNILSHLISTWIINDDALEECKLSLKSRKIEKNISSWVEMYKDEDIHIVINNLFSIFEKAKIKDTVELRKVKNIFKVYKGFKNIDRTSKELLTELIKYK